MDTLNDAERMQVLAVIELRGPQEAAKEFGFYWAYTLLKAAHGCSVSRLTTTIIRSKLELMRLESRLAP